MPLLSRPEPIPPRPGEESVWNYPRPPRLEREPRRLKVVFASTVIADTQSGFRVLETSHPPVYYFDPASMRPGVLQAPRATSICEWKGQARIFDVVVGGKRAPGAAWSYPDPTPAFAAIRDFVAFYAGPMDACFVGDERAEPQAGGFYGGWITSGIVGPFKGGPGSQFW